MARYRMKDGKVIEAETVQELVQKMKNTSFSETTNIREYMLSCAYRAEKLGMVVRYDNAENFVMDLLKHGIVTKLEETWN